MLVALRDPGNHALKADWSLFDPIMKLKMDCPKILEYLDVSQYDSLIDTSRMRLTTFTQKSRNILTIAGRDAKIVGFGRSTITFPHDTQVIIEDVLLYPDSTGTLISFRDI
jgi:hypothetical protein